MTVDLDTIHAARVLLAQLNLSPDDLTWIPPATVPTLADYLPTVIAAAGPGARRTYGSYWRRIHAAFGDRHLTRSAPPTSKPSSDKSSPTGSYAPTAKPANTPDNTSSAPSAPSTPAP